MRQNGDVFDGDGWHQNLQIVQYSTFP